jgi:GNAT superfamily N-acetyltransferase
MDTCYAIAEPSDSDAIVHLLAMAFSESEPPAVAMGLSFHDMEYFLRLVVPGIVEYGLTAVARDKDRGTLAGVCLTDDFAKPPALDLTAISPKFLPIFSMLEELDKEFWKGRSVSAGECLHLFMLAVNADYVGRGIAQGLIQVCVDNGILKGYRLAITEATGNVSQHVFRKSGFADQISVAYSDFVYQRRFVFAAIVEHQRAILMDRVLKAERTAAT